MKILIASNAPWAATGYGVQTASLARRLRDAGHKVVIYCQYGLQGGVQEWEGITCLPTGMDGGYTDPILRGHLRYTQPDLLITLFDVWPLAKGPIRQIIRESGAKWLAWAPIDAVPISADNLVTLGSAELDYPVLMSNFAEAALKKVDPGFRAEVIPHGIEKEWGFTANGRREFRRLNQIPDDAFLFTSVGRNSYYPGRKGFDRLIRAFAEAEIENSYLYLHTGKWSENGSVGIEKVVSFYQQEHPWIEDRVRYPDEYNLVMGYSQDGMNALYSATDCYVQPTLGEGFGLPVMEAQACGCAVIATDCTSMPDLVSPHSSILVPGVTEVLVPDPSHRVLIDIEKLKDAMREIAEIKRTDLPGFTAMKANAGMWANGWDWDRLWAEYWVPLLEKIEKDLEIGPRKDWHRGAAKVFEVDGRMRKRESLLGSPIIQKELALLDTLDHPNIIPVLGRGVDDGLSWYEMPKLVSLRDAEITDPDAIVNGVRSALVYFHEKGLCHRDIAPENVVLDGQHPYLIDFEWVGPCDGEVGKNCVDFEPWEVPEKCVPTVQSGMEQKGFHTIVTFVRGLKLDTKTHGYKGIPYQAVDGVGERDCETRWKLMNPDVKGKTVVDVGCNLGWFVRKAKESGARRAVGYDNDEAVVAAANKLIPSSRADFYAAPMDLNTVHPHTDGKYRYDVAFCLSVLQHLENPDRVFDWLMGLAETVYIEIPSRFVTQHMAERLSGADYLGESERGRPLYRVKVREAVAA